MFFILINKIKKYSLAFIFCLALFLSNSVQANQCLSNGSWVNAKNGFCITLNVKSDGGNRVRIEHNGYLHPLWTDDYRISGYIPSIYETKYLNDGHEHQFKIKFVNNDSYKSNNIRGWLQYSVDGVYVKSEYIDIRKTVGANKKNPYIRVRVIGDNISETCLAEGNCGSLPLPEPKLKPELDYCELFPSPAQGWVGNPNNKITMSNSSQINNAYLIDGKRQVGFENFESNNSSNCDGQSCVNNPDLQVNRMNLSEYTVTGTETIWKETKTLDPVQYDHMYLDNSTVTFNPGHYYFNYLEVNKSTININGPVVIHVKKLELSQNSTFNNNGTPDDLVILGYDPYALDSSDGPFPDCPLSLPGYSGCQINFANKDEFKGLIYSEGKVNLSNSVHVTGAVTASYLNMSNSAKITGDSQCFNPQPKNTLKITPKSAFGLTCERMPVTFSVRKENGDLDTDYSGTLNASVTSANPMNSCWALTEYAAECSKENITTSLPGGQRKLWLQSKTAGEISVEGTTGDLSDNAGPYRFAPYGFRVNGGDPAKTVAGKTETLLIEAVADTGAKCEVIEDYGKAEGEEKKLKITSLDYVQPTTGSKSLDIEGSTLADGASIVKSLRFTQGKTLLPVTYKDAGEISFELADDKWQPKDCETDSTDCDDRERDWKGLKGKAVIYSRPYTFALCDIQSAGGKTDFSGTSSSGNGFAAAGETFSVTFKPIIWTQDLPNLVSDSMTGNTWCKVPTTPNYYSVDKVISAPLNLTYLLDTPVGGDKGVLQGNGTHSFKTQQDAMHGLTLSNLSWSEVGSLRLQAGSHYLGMKIDQGVGSIGRFYPDYFELEDMDSDDFSYPSGQDEFAYLGQDFEASFEVEAKANNGEETENYGKFTSYYQASLALDAVQLIGGTYQSFASRVYPQTKWNNWDEADLKQESSIWRLERKNFSNTTTIEDGPFDELNSSWGLYALEGKGGDPVRIVNENQQTITFSGNDLVTEMAPFSKTPVLRYGRMRMEDTAGAVGQSLAIPLRVEFWDGSGWKINADDSLSAFRGTNYCKQQIGSSDDKVTSNADTRGNGNVAAGDTDSGDFLARPHHQNGKPLATFREQIRFWQRLTSTHPVKIKSDDNDIKCVGNHSNQPWLRFNWRDKGDEDPSAIVTFGVYRGNDRIIYRGEKGMNKLLN
ncbi:DUF6701 domain-containing protein [Photobacterium sp.]|uniref:DUF6701 domain-containing protein n=1 Tax=Photobacterium sp. TaxID=660 RepID=UPI00299E9F2D|nr:DUF6701 domain-containing protein [Photobacterium sp.]MDX1303800.1 DUF6701 domain-containing protein [Photobacterium sp.]